MKLQLKYILTVAVFFYAFTVSSQMATNPLLFADVPDVSMVRVGDTYYMSSTTMHMNPGVPIMKSTDLVNWELVSYCYASFDNTDSYNLDNGRNDYGHGSWASSIRYHEGIFYVVTFANTGKTYVFTTQEIENGTWELNVINGSYHDCSLFFDDDGRTYLFYGGGDIKLIELSADAKSLAPGASGRTIIENAAAFVGPVGLNAEGCQVLKRNGYYYINNICWPSGSMRTQILHRSRNIAGPYESRVILQDQGVAQGSFIETPAGDWYAYLFRDYGAVGRIPYLVPMQWGSDDWPELDPVPNTLNIPRGEGGMHNIVASDEFSNAAPLKLAWQWNHNPKNNYWSLSDREGFMRLHNFRTDANVLMTNNTLTQRTFGPHSTAYTALHVSGMQNGDFAGMVALQKQYGYVGVQKLSGNTSIVMVTGDDVDGTQTIRESVPLDQEIVYLRVDCNFENRADDATFYYSLDGNSWTRIGAILQMSYTIPHFMGYRFGLFSYATQLAGGYADFDFYRVGTDINTIFNSVSGPSISFVSPTEHSFVAPAFIPIDVDVSDADGDIDHVDYYLNNELIAEKNEPPYGLEYHVEIAGKYTVRAVAYDNDGNFSEDVISIVVNVPQSPYGGVARAIPGIIQFEEYDEGGNGFAYFDVDEGSNVDPLPDFRTNEDVEIEMCTDTNGGYNLGWTAAGEWLEYTVNVETTGFYTLEFRVACDMDSRTISLLSNANILVPEILIPNTGGWQEWQTVSVSNVNLEQGEQVLRLEIGANDYVNLNYMKFSHERIAPPIALKTGWNIIGYPFEESASMASILSKLNNSVLEVKNLDGFYDKSINPQLNSLTEFEWGKGYFIKVTDDCILEW